MQHSDSTAVTTKGKQCKQLHHQFTPTEGSSGTSSSLTGIHICSRLLLPLIALQLFLSACIQFSMYVSPGRRLSNSVFYKKGSIFSNNAKIVIFLSFVKFRAEKRAREQGHWKCEVLGKYFFHATVDPQALNTSL